MPQTLREMLFKFCLDNMHRIEYWSTIVIPVLTGLLN